MTQDQGARRAERRARVEAALVRYPAIDAHELDELRRWFRKEATALDVGMIASDPLLTEPYRLFAAQHLNPLTATDVVRAAAIILGVIAFFGVMLWLTY